MARLVTHIAITCADIEAYKRDLFGILIEYGAPDVQPHRRAAFLAELKRAGDVFVSCFFTRGPDGPDEPLT